MAQVQLSGSVILELPVPFVQSIVKGLQELPYREAQPIILHIERQLVEIQQRQMDQARGQKPE